MEGDPIRGERYRVVGTDGTVLKEGTLNSNGEARVSPVEAGTYKVTFPDLEESAWARLA